MTLNCLKLVSLPLFCCACLLISVYDDRVFNTEADGAVDRSARITLVEWCW